MEDNRFNKDLKLYVDFVIPSTVEEFLFTFLFTHITYDKFYARGLATYEDKELEILHTPLGKMRSFDDIFVTVRTYFPDVTLSLVLRILLSLKNKKYPFLKPYLTNCDTIRRIRFVYYRDALDYDNHNCNKYDSAYDWEELLNEAGINEYINFSRVNSIYIDEPDTFLSTKEGVFLADEFKK